MRTKARSWAGGWLEAGRSSSALDDTEWQRRSRAIEQREQWGARRGESKFGFALQPKGIRTRLGQHT
jgi:hypothetical protein